MQLLECMFSEGWVEFYSLGAVNHKLFIYLKHMEEWKKVENVSGW